MTYPSPFHRIVMIGTLYGDIFNTTLAMAPSDTESLPPVDEDLLIDVAVAIGGWWSKPAAPTYGNGAGICEAAALTSIKVNRIGVNGKYADDTTREYTYALPVKGSNANLIAPQLSAAVSFTGAAPRALAGRGRMYLPPVGAFASLGIDGRITATNAQNVAMGVSTLISAIELAYDSNGLVSLPSIASKTRTGAFQRIQTVGVGRVPDTIRSRRNKQDEDYQIVDVDDAP